MNILKKILPIFFVIPLYSVTSNDSLVVQPIDPFSDTNIAVTNEFYNDGLSTNTESNRYPQFIHDTIITQDGYHLAVSVKRVKNAQATIICVHGVSTRKERLHPITRSFPRNVNIILLEPRDVGQSSSRFSRFAIWRYGQNEWKDILAAKQYTHKILHTDKIILFGVCSGAHNIFQFLTNTTKKEQKGIQAIIADSSWTDLGTITPQAASYFIGQTMRRYAPRRLVKLFRRPLGSYITSACSKTLNFIATPLVQLCSRLSRSNKKTIETTLKTTAIPILFIHAKNDPLAPFDNIQKIVTESKIHQFCFFEGNTHGDGNRIKNQNSYQICLALFCHLKLNNQLGHYRQSNEFLI